MKINFGNQEMLLHSSGMAFLPQSRTGIVSDLHLEKASHFAKRGFFLPPYDSQVTLNKLLAAANAQGIETLIILGDCFHDGKGHARMDVDANALFSQLLQFNPVWIKGNHDGDFVPNGFAAYEIYEQDGLVFTHQAQPGMQNEISGHFHPKVQITHKGANVQRPCFIEDGKKMIMPAFGAYTGGLFVDDPVIARLFGHPYRTHVLGEDRIYSFVTNA